MIKGTRAAQLVDYGIPETSLWRSKCTICQMRCSLWYRADLAFLVPVIIPCLLASRSHLPERVPVVLTNCRDPVYKGIIPKLVLVWAGKGQHRAEMRAVGVGTGTRMDLEIHLSPGQAITASTRYAVVLAN